MMVKSQDEKIGFVGVGRMGANMARRLHELGYRVAAVYDVIGERAQELAQELGCEAVSISSQGCRTFHAGPDRGDGRCRHATHFFGGRFREFIGSCQGAVVYQLRDAVSLSS